MGKAKGGGGKKKIEKRTKNSKYRDVQKIDEEAGPGFVELFESSVRKQAKSENKCKIFVKTGVEEKD